jgi:hypothetical protein
MKTIVEKSSGLSKFVLSDDVTVKATKKHITVGTPAQFIINDMNSTTATIINNVTNTPEDWTGNKYLFDGSNWSINSEWVDPSISEGEE